MLINWIALICIVALVSQVMFFFYMNALSDLKPKKSVRRAKTITKRARKAEYSSQTNYINKIAK
ncbi:hypothetical protein SAMN02744037_02182 [Tepidibacter formicigenes DSM 15518]|uniref:Uncharacterized protein n=1 Tax=Tepidibacter formicigenes DSM 15518 TaxID=1123349 RepID=A0A1M6RUI0_9FIRM|nr:hypothetical protein SAMN02744037_02182 [Tepidibacter formicigenes DSM 15518]